MAYRKYKGIQNFQQKIDSVFLLWFYLWYYWNMSTSDSHETFCFNLFLFGFSIFISSRQIVQNASKYHVTNFSPKYEISGYQIMLVRSNRVAQNTYVCIYEFTYMRFTFLDNIVYVLLQYKFIISMMLKLIITRLYAIKYQFNFVWSLRNCTKEDCMSLILWHELIKPCL